jgi:hypothetical protein
VVNRLGVCVMGGLDNTIYESYHHGAGCWLAAFAGQCPGVETKSKPFPWRPGICVCSIVTILISHNFLIFFHLLLHSGWFYAPELKLRL